jgi:SAM-dependent methyltransferase
MKNISILIKIFRSQGLIGVFKIISRKFPLKKVKNYKVYQELFYNMDGIEIGGPSPIFKKFVPIYSIIKSLDGVNFNSNTIWEGTIIEGQNFKFRRREKGFQFICDGINLERIRSGKYDFVLSCNNLEHIANPIKALTEWLRIVKNGGLLLLILPNKSSNFDHKRNITSMTHLLDDFNNNTSEQDLTHLEEILSLHDLSMDIPAGDFEMFKKRSLDNYYNRCLHHHVFDMILLEEIFMYFNLELLLKDSTETDYIILGRKLIIQ